METVLLFPGQGSQYVGMGHPLAETESVVRRTFEEADEVLGRPLSRILREGPEEDLAATRNTQPAVLAYSVALYRLLARRHGDALEVKACAGHSLGEYSALVAAGGLAFPDALRAVQERARILQEASPRHQGAMAALLGVPPEPVEALCADLEAEMSCCLQVSAYNAPFQIVVSGHTEAVKRAVERSREIGCSRARFLEVSAPFHCRLLEPARGPMRELLAALPLKDTRVPVWQNVDAAPHSRADEIRENLEHQVVRPVRWVDTVRNLVELGPFPFLEVGPSRVMAGLVRKVERRRRIISLDRTDAWDRLHALLESARG